jgi:hypothetical protein
VSLLGIMVVALDEQVRAARAAVTSDDDYARMMVDMLVTLSSQRQAEVAFAPGDVDAAVVAWREAIRAEEALRGLQDAVAAQNRGAEAKQLQAELVRAWQEADVSLRSVPRS